MNRPLLACWLLAVALPGAGTWAAAEEPGVRAPYESAAGFVPSNPIDACVLAELTRRGIPPSNLCSDAVFLRRVYVDVLGVLPEPTETLAFLRDDEPAKRQALVDRLLARPEHAEMLALKWCDLLRVKAEFPINLWPNGVQAYYRWILDAMRENRPYDVFARRLLTASGSNFREAPVNFYRAVQRRTPASLAAAVALTFMGVRSEHWPEERRAGMAAFFSRLVYKPTAEWKEEIVIHDPKPSGPLEAVFPDGTGVTIPPDEDPRRVFADWLLRDGNPWFARAIANRVWSWYLGRGIVHEPDDLRPDNPPSNEALLLYLEREVTRSRYDLRKLIRLILTSRTYQGSPLPQSEDPQAAACFAHYLPRRIDAEILMDTLCRLDGQGEDYVSVVPEPFTILPGLTRTVRLADGTITSPFLEMFGRPARDTGLESERSLQPTSAQRLFLLNSRDVQRRIQRCAWLRRLAGASGRSTSDMIRSIYVALLSRTPTPEEQAVAQAYVRSGGLGLHEAACDLAWALINTKEFLYRH